MMALEEMHLKASLPDSSTLETEKIELLTPLALVQRERLGGSHCHHKSRISGCGTHKNKKAVGEV